MQMIDQYRVVLGCTLFLIESILMIHVFGYSKSFREKSITKEGKVKYHRILIFIFMVWLLYRARLHFFVEWMNERDYMLDSLAFTGVAIINTAIHVWQYRSASVRPKRKELEEAAKAYKEIWNCGCIVFGILMVIYAFTPSTSVEDVNLINNILMLVFIGHKTAGFLYNIFTVDQYKSVPKPISERHELIPMSSADSRAYCRYRNKKRLEVEAVYVIGTLVFCPCMVFIIPDFLEPASTRVVQGICVVVFMYVLIKILPQWLKVNAKYKEAGEHICEYVRVSLEMDQCLGLMCTDNHEVSFDTKLEDGDSVLIYVPSLDKVFKESIKDVEAVITIPQTQSVVKKEEKVEKIKVYHLTQMSLEESQKFCEFRYKNCLEVYMIGVIATLILMGLPITFLIRNNVIKGILYAIIVFYNVKWGIPDVIAERKMIKQAEGFNYEWVRTIAEKNAKLKLISSDGREIFFQYSNPISLGETSMVLVCVPELNKVYAEDVLLSLEQANITIPQEISNPTIEERVLSEDADGNPSTLTKVSYTEDVQSYQAEPETFDGPLQKMSFEEMNTYRKYRYEREKKKRVLIMGMAGLALLLLFIMYIVGSESLNTTILILMMIGLVGMIIAFFVLTRIQLNQWNAPITMPYEYTFRRVVLNKECELVRENGEKVKYRLEGGRKNRFVTNERVVVVFIPDSKHIYIEKKSEWDKLYSAEWNNITE